jgi:hypothetical protein
MWLGVGRYLCLSLVRYAAQEGMNILSELVIRAGFGETLSCYFFKNIPIPGWFAVAIGQKCTFFCFTVNIKYLKSLMLGIMAFRHRLLDI